MKLKDLIMQVTYEDIEQSIAHVFETEGRLEINDWRKQSWRKMFDTLQAMEPEPDCDMKLAVVHGDVSGYFDEETRKKNPEYDDRRYSLVMMPWRKWLGMEVDTKTLNNLPVADILGNCIYEMSYFGYDEESIKKHIQEMFASRDKGEDGGDGGNEKEEVDEKTKCLRFVSSFIPEILPYIAEKIGDESFEQALKAANCSENGAFYDPISVTPFCQFLTDIGFFYVYIDGKCMFGVAPAFDGKIDVIEYIKFASSMKELKAFMESEDGKKQISETLLRQIEKKLSNDS